MNSQFGAIFFHRLSDSTELSEDELIRLNTKLSEVLSEFGMSFEQYEHSGYSSEHPFAACSRCGLLTAGFPLSTLGEGGPLESFIKQSVLQGVLENGGVLCSECQAT